MQKQLVLAALFATAHAADCTDSNVVMAKAKVAKNAAALAGLDTTLAAALKAKDAAVLNFNTATKDLKTWTDAMKTFTDEQALANTNAADQAKVVASTAAAVALLKNSGSTAADIAANKLLPLWKAEDAKTTANTVVTSSAAGSLNAKNTAAQIVTDKLVANDTAHTKIKDDLAVLRTAAKDAWVAGRLLVDTTTPGLITAAKLKWSVGKISIRSVATGKMEDMRKCTSAGIGNAGSNAGTVWNKGSNNNTTGAANAAADAAKEYKDNYLDCANPVGYTADVTAKKAISSATGASNTTYDTWFAAQHALEERAYKFGKLLHACQSGTDYTDSIAATPCLRTGGFEDTYSSTYAGLQGTQDFTFPISADAWTGAVVVAAGLKKGDFADDGHASDAAKQYTKAGAIVEYVAAVGATTAGTAATSMFLARDTAYNAWLVKVQDTADKIVLENKATIEYRRLQLLGTAYDAATAVNSSTGKIVTLKAVGSQARAVEDLRDKLAQDKTDLGKAADTHASASATAAAMTDLAALTALGDKLKIETTSPTAMTKTKWEAIVTAATGLVKAYLQASVNYNLANTKAVQAAADKARAQTAQGLITTAITKAKTDLTIKTYLFDEETKKYNAADKASKAAIALNTKYTAAKAIADTVNTKANLRGDFYKDVLAKATAAQTVATSAWDLATKAKAANGTDKTAFAAAEVVAINNCKAVGYAKAQATLKDINAKATTDAALAKTVAAAYAKKSARPAGAATASPVGSDCAFGPITDGAPKPRNVCAEGLCCGAANKFLKDGTKLTVETCQKATDISYTFYPQIKAGATVAPAAEQWRFSCISGAKNLAATATAALAAAYLMA